MLDNYIKTALRSLAGFKVYSLVLAYGGIFCRQGRFARSGRKFEK